MPVCPACAGSRIHTGPASRATGRRISGCRDCGAHFWAGHRDAAHLAAIEAQEELTAAEYSDWVSTKREQAAPEAWRDGLRWIQDALGSRASTGSTDAPLLYDVGAGDGHFLSVARDEFGFRVTGNEIAKGAVDLARERYDVDLDLGVLEDLDRAGTADAATLWCVLAHVPDGDQLLSEVHTLLKPGGVLFLQTPHWTGADGAALGVKTLTRGRMSKVPDRRIAQHHWILHTRQSITAQLGRLGYVDVVAEPKIRYTLTSRAYLASMNPPQWTIGPAAWMLDRAVGSGIAPRIILDVRARKA